MRCSVANARQRRLPNPRRPATVIGRSPKRSSAVPFEFVFGFERLPSRAGPLDNTRVLAGGGRVAGGILDRRQPDADSQEGEIPTHVAFDPALRRCRLLFFPAPSKRRFSIKSLAST